MDDGDRFDEYRADQMVREHDAREESALIDQRDEEIARAERKAFVEKLTEMPTKDEFAMQMLREMLAAMPNATTADVRMLLDAPSFGSFRDEPEVTR